MSPEEFQSRLRDITPGDGYVDTEDRHVKEDELALLLLREVADHSELGLLATQAAALVAVMGDDEIERWYA